MQIYRGYIDFWWKRRHRQLERHPRENSAPGLIPMGSSTVAQWDRSMIERDFAAVARALTSPRLESFLVNGQPMPKSLFEGCTVLAQGDVARAQASFEATRPQFESAVEEALASPPDTQTLDCFTRLWAASRRRFVKAVELAPEWKDAVVGPWMAGISG
jgi:hypothetical protein